MSEFTRSYELGEDLERELAAKFNIYLSELELLGKGSYGKVWKIDEISVLKMTESEAEKETVLKLIETGLTLELGHTTVLPQDTFTAKIWFAYRRELLVPLNDARLEFDKYNKIKRDLFKVQRAMNDMYLGFQKEKSNEQECADKFLQEMSRLGFLQKTELVAIILFAYQAVIKKIFLWDVHEDNVGFRIDENGEPVLDAGLVFFDPMASVINQLIKA
jgi:hypothetical protein